MVENLCSRRLQGLPPGRVEGSCQGPVGLHLSPPSQGLETFGDPWTQMALIILSDMDVGGMGTAFLDQGHRLCTKD